MATSFKDIDSYIKIQSTETKTVLEKIRQTIKKAAPQAEEVISYNMPAFKYCGMLVYFAAYENHIGFYPTASGIANFKTELSKYKGAKGSVQFPLDEKVPYSLIKKIVKYRVNQNLEKANAIKRMEVRKPILKK